MKTIARARRHERIRHRLAGTAARPRLVVFRGSKSLSAQLVDDAAGSVLLTVTSQGKASKAGSGIPGGTALGTAVAKAAKTKKIETVVFDRAGYRYHGVVKALVEAAREGGLKI